MKQGGYIPFKNTGNKLKTSFFPHISGFWNCVPKNVQCKDKDKFPFEKIEVKNIEVVFYILSSWV